MDENEYQKQTSVTSNSSNFTLSSSQDSSNQQPPTDGHGQEIPTFERSNGPNDIQLQTLVAGCLGNENYFGKPSSLLALGGEEGVVGVGVVVQGKVETTSVDIHSSTATTKVNSVSDNSAGDHDITPGQTLPILLASNAYADQIERDKVNLENSTHSASALNRDDYDDLDDDGEEDEEHESASDDDDEFLEQDDEQENCFDNADDDNQVTSDTLNKKVLHQSSHNHPNVSTFKEECNGNVYCRLCARLTPSGVDIFASDETDKSLHMSLYEKLVTYFPILITKDDLLPKKVCTDCINQIEITLKFNQQIVNAHKFFLDRLEVGNPLSLPTLSGIVKQEGVANPDTAAKLSKLPSYLQQLTKANKKKKKRYVLMEVEGAADRRQANKIKKRFLPSLTTCAICDTKSATTKGNSEHWGKVHAGMVIEYK